MSLLSQSFNVRPSFAIQRAESFSIFRFERIATAFAIRYDGQTSNRIGDGQSSALANRPNVNYRLGQMGENQSVFNRVTIRASRDVIVRLIAAKIRKWFEVIEVRLSNYKFQPAVNTAVVLRSEYGSPQIGSCGFASLSPEHHYEHSNKTT